MKSIYLYKPATVRKLHRLHGIISFTIESYYLTEQAGNFCRYKLHEILILNIVRSGEGCLFSYQKKDSDIRDALYYKCSYLEEKFEVGFKLVTENQYQRLQMFAMKAVQRHFIKENLFPVGGKDYFYAKKESFFEWCQYELLKTDFPLGEHVLTMHIEEYLRILYKKEKENVFELEIRKIPEYGKGMSLRVHKHLVDLLYGDFKPVQYDFYFQLRESLFEPSLSKEPVAV